MSNFLDDKTDTEIEEIYNRATMEDLQSMLTQEKCLNRRRILRKVMRTKSSNPGDISNNPSLSSTVPKIDTKETTIDINKTRNIPNKSQENEIRIKNDDDTLKQLNEKRKQLHDIVDLGQRKELRKEIQNLENQCGLGQKAINQNTCNSLNSESNQALNNSKPKKELEKKEKVEDLQFSSNDFPSDIKDKISIDSRPKFNFIKTPDKSIHSTNKDKHEIPNISETPFNDKTDKVSNDSFQNSTKTRNDQINNQTGNVNSKIFNEDFQKLQKINSETKKASNIDNLSGIGQNKTDKKNCLPSQDGNASKCVTLCTAPLADNLSHSSSKSELQSHFVYPTADSKQKQLTTKTIPQTPTPELSAKPNVSQVSSARERFENHSVPSIANKPKSSTKFSEKEINDILNAVLKPEEVTSKSNKGASNDPSLTIPEGRSRKISQQNIIMMIPQMKKKAQIARSSVQVKKEQLLIFCQLNTQEYQNVKITNYSKSWADGLAFCALIHHFYPESFDYKALSSKDPLKNFTLAFETAKKYAGIEPLIEPDDMMILESPDEKCIYTYIQFMYNALKNHPKNSAKRAENP